MAMSKRKKWLLAMVGSVVLVYVLNSHLPAITKHKRSRIDPPFDELHTHFTHNASRKSSSSLYSSQGKQWPSLISQLPWLLSNSKLPPHSCEGYFGNGFTEDFRIFPWENPARVSKSDKNPLPFKVRDSKSDTVESSLHCFYSETLRTSICEGRKIVMHPGRIYMTAGGEALDSVVGRTDADELPSFSAGAFQIMTPPDVFSRVSDWAIARELLDVVLPQGQVHDHKLRSLFTNIRTVSSDDISCSQEVRESTLLVIRYEYANLFHTATDWYSAYVASRVLSLPQRPNVVFIDGHCQSPMDDGWESLFSNVKYAKSFPASVCFDHVVFTPLGYETALFKGLNSGIPCQGCTAEELKRADDTTKTARLREFGEMFKAAFDVVERRTSRVNVLFVRRESYLAHPRHSGKPEIRLQNEQELFNAMEKWAWGYSHGIGKRNVRIINGTLAHMRMREQVQAVEDASIIVGVHGAGLTHILFARPGTVILELLSPLFQRPHYAHISQWMGLEYHSITMPGTIANCPEVLEQLSVIMDKVA